MELLAISIGIGLVVSLLCTELFGIASAGLVVPGYIALYVTEPQHIATTIGVALASLKGIAPLVDSFVPAAVYYLPETLPALVRTRVTGGIMPSEWPITAIAMILFCELFVALAIWRFRREEF